MKELKISGTISSEVITSETGEALKFSIYDILFSSLFSPAPESRAINYGYLSSVANLLRTLKKAHEGKKESILIDTIDHQALVGSLKIFVFKIADPAFQTFINSIENLPDVEVKKAEDIADKDD